MVKKLTDEEIEEYKHENYQMMAAVARKPLSELMGETSKRPNFNENYCLIKQMYLKNCVDPISSKQLYDVLRNQGYKAKNSTFRGLLNYYVKNGYIQKTNAKKPFLYVLADEGKLHAKNPFILVDENIIRYQNFQLNKIGELLLNQPEILKQLIEDITNMNLGSSNFGGTSGGSLSSVGGQSGFTANDYGGIEEMKAKIEDDGFLQNLDEDKIKALVALGDPELMTDFVINLQDYHQRHKSVMNLNPNNIPTGRVNDKKSMPNYFPEMFNSFGKDVTEKLFNLIPYRFYRHKATGKIRISGRNEAGNYAKNNDGVLIEYQTILRDIFSGVFKIDGVKTIENNEEIIKVYYYNSQIKFHILNASQMQYNEYLNIPKEKPKTLSMNGKPIGGSPIQPKIKNSKLKPSVQNRIIKIIKK